MKGIKIDVVKREVYEVDIPKGIDGIYTAIEARPFDCIFLNAERTEVLYVDDEGLLHKPIGAFHFYLYPTPLSGHGLILGLKGPKTCSTKYSVEEIRNIVTFVPTDQLPEPSIKVYTIN